MVAAEDDYGLSLCQLYRSLNDSRYMPTDLVLPDGRPRRADLRMLLPLNEYGLSPGDEIKLFARVVDNDPLGEVEGVGKGSERAT